MNIVQNINGIFMGPKENANDDFTDYLLYIKEKDNEIDFSADVDIYIKGNYFLSEKYYNEDYNEKPIGSVLNNILVKQEHKNFSEKTKNNINKLFEKGLKFDAITLKNERFWLLNKINSTEENIMFVLNKCKEYNVLDIKKINDEFGLLNFAVYNNYINLIDLLINDFKINPNCQNKDGKTPIMFVKQIETLNKLIEFDIDLNIKDNENKSVFNYVKEHIDKEKGNELYNYLYNNLNNFKKSEKENLDLNSFIKDGIISSLNSSQNTNDLIKQLKNYKGKVKDIVDNDGNNLMFLAIKNFKYSFFNYLIENYNFDINYKNKKGEPLIYALKNFPAKLKGDPEGKKIKEIFDYLRSSEESYKGIVFSNVVISSFELFQKKVSFNWEITNEIRNLKSYQDYQSSLAKKSDDLSNNFLNFVFDYFGRPEEKYFFNALESNMYSDKIKPLLNFINYYPEDSLLVFLNKLIENNKSKSFLSDYVSRIITAIFDNYPTTQILNKIEEYNLFENKSFKDLFFSDYERTKKYDKVKLTETFKEASATTKMKI